MSALRGHFQSSSSQRRTKSGSATKLPIKLSATSDGSLRQGSKLAKKSSRQATATDASGNGKRSSASPSVVPAETKQRTPTTTLNQLREQMLASGSSSRDALPPPPTLRTPSLISGSSVSTFDSPRSNILRRKPSTIGNFVAKQRSEALGIEHDRTILHSRNGDYAEAMEDSVFGIVMPPTRVTPFSAVEGISRHDDVLYGPASTVITGTPSTRFADSPFSHVPTPSSFSSQSTAPPIGHNGNKPYRELVKEKAIPVLEMSRPERSADAQPTGRARDALTGSKSSRLSYARPVQGSALPNGPRSQNDRPSKFEHTRSSARRSIVPELAYLNELSPRKSAAQPVRPSREGLTDLDIVQPLSPVVQSDLAPATFHQRTSSRDSIASGPSNGLRSRFLLSPKPASERSSPLVGTSMSGRLTPATSSSVVQPPQSHAPAPASAASASPAKTHRFGLFSRKSKDDASKKLEKPHREPRKMPVAGTGHERYGRFGFGQRNNSVTSPVGNQSPSTESISSNKSSSFLRRKNSGASDKSSELDTFLRDRLTPVVLRGSGSNFSNFTSASLHSGNGSIDGESLETQSALGSTPSISQSSFQHSHLNRASIRLAEISQSDRATPRDAVGTTSREPVREGHTVVEFSSHNVSPPLPELSTVGKEGLWLQPLETDQKPARKWNFLQRLQSSPSRSRTVVAADISSGSPDVHRNHFDNAAHCALLDTIEPIELDEVEELVREADDDIVMPTGFTRPEVMLHKDKRHSLLPSQSDVERLHTKRYSKSALPQSDRSGSGGTSTMAAATAKPLPIKHDPPQPPEEARSLLRTPELNGDQSPRIPRLSPIGRIPRVVSKRDQDRKLPDVSFSRPFASTQPRPNVKPPGTLYNQIRELASPVEGAAQQFPLPAQDNGTDKQKHSSKSDEWTMYSAANLFSLPLRKNSDFSCSSSSDTASWMAYSRMQALQDEDIWDEYEDLMNDTALGNTSMYHKAYFSSHQSPPYRELPPIQDGSYFGVPPTREPSHALPRPPKPTREGSNASTKQASTSKMIQPVQDNSIYSMTRAAFSRQSTTSTTTIDSSRNSRISTRSRAASVGEANVRSSHTSFSSTGQERRESMKLSSIAQGHTTPPSVDLKLEAMMTSKKLSFDRVLFSPAHNEIRLADEPRVLILDGLGSDWSYFVAMFYPQAKIYNLGPSGRQGTAREGHQPNHCNIAYAALGAPLPFPKGFFTAAVFRYPIAATDQAYLSCIAEFKRVLRPGGHLEVTVLDIDMDSAGSRAKQAVRGLKTRMQQHHEHISLRSLSDFVLQLIGKRGFVEVQRCMIGLPVMCRNVRYSNGSSGSSNASTERAGKRTSLASQMKAKTMATLVEQAQSDAGNVEPTHDEKMTASVARVGRYFYSQCYESILNDKSMFSDQALLQECQQLNTSFRLLICYAQKPTQARRRTMSV